MKEYNYSYTPRLSHIPLSGNMVFRTFGLATYLIFQATQEHTRPVFIDRFETNGRFRSTELTAEMTLLALHGLS